jgi:hypothetical protein
LYVPFDFGMSIFTGHITQNAVRDGARIASSTQPFDSGAADALASQVYGTLPQLLVSGSFSPKRVTVNYYGDGAAECAQSVEVIAQGTYNFFLYRLMALAGFTVPNGMAITRTTRMRYQHQPTSNGGTGATTSFCGTVTVAESHP